MNNIKNYDETHIQIFENKESGHVIEAEIRVWVDNREGLFWRCLRVLSSDFFGEPVLRHKFKILKMYTR